MKQILKLSIAVAAIFVSLASAQAYDTASFTLISSPSIGTGTMGTVTLTQNGANEVDVTVALAANTDFISTSGSHNAFAFNLDLETAIAIGIPPSLSNIFIASDDGASNTPYGNFGYVIDCPGCGPGSSNANPGPLTFSVVDSTGIKISDFVANAGGYYFSSDVIGPAGGTGNIAANTVYAQSVPEPATLTILGSGLIGLALLRRVRAGAPTLFRSNREASDINGADSSSAAS